MIKGIFSLYLGVLDSLLFPLLTLQPLLAILLVSVILSLISITISALTVNKEVYRQLKEKIFALQKEIKVAQRQLDTKTINKLANEIIKTNFQMLRLRMKGIAIAFGVILIFFPWLNHHYGEVVLAKLPFSLPIIGNGIGWIWWYIFVSMVTVYVVRKLLRINYV